MGTLTARLKTRARELGFAAVGIAPRVDPAHPSAFVEWLRCGYQGEMTYLSRTAEKRLSPKSHLPWVKSAVVAAWAYGVVEGNAAVRGVRGHLARYARGDDYHGVIAERLTRLFGWVRECAGQDVPGQVFVDTGPILERDLAVQAGLGWIGKNANVISPELGSFFCLGVLFLGVALEPDRPIEDQCGPCRACLDACPTHAFVAPRVLDARRCVSYLTTQMRGAIPIQLRPPIGRHVFGCDMCQEACPHNIRRSPAVWQAASAQPEWESAELLSLLGLTDARFRETFRASPLVFVKRRGLLRNICVALGNGGNRDHVSILARLLRDDPEPLVRAHAAWALGRIGGSGALASLEGAEHREADAAASREIRQALVSLPRG